MVAQTLLPLSYVDLFYIIAAHYLRTHPFMKAPLFIRQFLHLLKISLLIFASLVCLKLSATETFTSDEHKEIIRYRVENLDDRMNYHFDAEVDSFVHIYFKQRISVVTKALRRSETYFPYIDSVFVAHNIPWKLRYLAVVESLLDPKAVSPAGATGMWQFMPGTGNMYGLKNNSEIDERLDYKKSTIAAAQYLKDLKDQFGDWFLAMAAYNCGPGNIRSYIRRSDGNYSFQKIKHRLPKETFEYIPKFIAISYLMEYAPEYKLVPRRPSVDLVDALPSRDPSDVNTVNTSKVILETEPGTGESDIPFLTKVWRKIKETFA